jgi:hypothetical protein
MNKDFDLFCMSEDREELRWAVRNVAEDKIAPDADVVVADASFPQANALSPLCATGRDLFAYDKQCVGGLTLPPRTPSPKSAARAPSGAPAIVEDLLLRYTDGGLFSDRFVRVQVAVPAGEVQIGRRSGPQRRRRR